MKIRNIHNSRVVHETTKAKWDAMLPKYQKLFEIIDTKDAAPVTTDIVIENKIIQPPVIPPGSGEKAKDGEKTHKQKKK